MDYTTLDHLIVLAVTRSRCTPLNARDVAAEGCRIGQETGRDDMRIIDARIQALRKAGNIVWLPKAKAPNGKAGWYVTTTDTAGQLPPAKTQESPAR